jgi:hypothetical protein
VTIVASDQVSAAVARALKLDPGAGHHAAIAAVAQALCLVPEAVAEVVLSAAADAPLPLRDGGTLDPRCAWPFPPAFEVHA